MFFLFFFSISIPIESWPNEFLEEIQVRGIHFTRFPSIRPYEITELKKFEEAKIYQRFWLANLSSDFRYDTVKVLRLKPAVFSDWVNFSFFLQPVVKFGKDSLPPHNVFMGLYASDYERAYVKFDHPNFGVFIGRERFALGPSPRYNLLLSGHSPPLDWVYFSLPTKIVKLSFYLSRLDDMVCKPLAYDGDTITQLINARRYLQIKRLDISPTDWINFSFSEAATFGGENFVLGPYYFNPLVLLHSYQYNWAKDANIFFHLDGRIYLMEHLSFYGALLVDDFQLEQDPNNEPHHLGINGGIEVADLIIKNSFLIAEYTALTRYVYCHFIPYQRYEYLGHPIGSLLGTDYDELYIRWIYHIDQKIDFYTEFSHLRKGITDIDTMWPIPENPRIPGTSFPEDNFLSGVVQRSINIGVGVRIFARRSFFTEFFIGYSLTESFCHKIGETKNFPFVRFKIDLVNLYH